MKYADYTTNDVNPVKRWIQNRRLDDALRYAGEIPRDTFVLDYGTGNGEFAKRLLAHKITRIVAFEPAPAMFAEAQENLDGFPDVVLCRDVNDLKTGSFDAVFCLEVFEHLPPEQTDIALSEIDRLLSDHGVGVIGVPHELFVPAAIKGIFRMTRRFGAFDAHPWNVLLAVLGRPPRRTVGMLEGLLPVHPDHLGFDYRKLESLLAQRFKIQTKRFSPLPMLSFLLNSEVYFVIKKKPCK